MYDDDQPTPSLFRRRRALLVVVALLLAGAFVAGPVGAGLFDRKVSPRTRVLSPVEDAVLEGGDLLAIGNATHRVGVAGVRIVVKNLDENTYWNGESWQSGFIRTEATIGKPGKREVVWSFRVPEPAMTDGRYRVRGFAYSVQGNGDSHGGDLHEFTYQAEPSEPTPNPTPSPSPTPTPSTAPIPTVPTTAGPEPTSTSVIETTTSTESGSSTTAAPTTTVAPTTAKPTTTGEPATTVAPTTTTEPTTTIERPPSGCGDRNILEPCTGLLLGTSGDFAAADGSWQSPRADFLRQEAKLGHRFDVFHEYNQWRDLVTRWPNAETQALADDGRIIFANWKSPTSSPGDWAQIAGGRYDADIRTAAARVIDFGDPVFLSFFHEPEDDIKRAAAGDTAKEDALVADYAAAWSRIVDVFDQEGADNAIWVWNIQGWRGHYRLYEAGLYPGDDVIDWVSYNNYNWHGCDNHGDSRKWTGFEDVFTPFYEWLEADGPGRPGTDKPIMLGEWGTEENDRASNSDQTKAEWLGEARRHFVDGTFPRIKAAIYFDTEGVRADGSIQFCRWALDSTPASLDAFRDLMAEPSLRPTWN